MSSIKKKSTQLILRRRLSHQRRGRRWKVGKSATKFWKRHSLYWRRQHRQPPPQTTTNAVVSAVSFLKICNIICRAPGTKCSTKWATSYSLPTGAILMFHRQSRPRHPASQVSSPITPSLVAGSQDVNRTDLMRLRWSRGSVLAFGTQVRGIIPDRSRRIFQGEKNSQHAFLRKGSKAVCPMSHVKEPESVCVEVAAFGPNYRPFLAQVVPPFTTRVSGGDTWRCK